MIKILIIWCIVLGLMMFAILSYADVIVILGPGGVQEGTIITFPPPPPLR